MACSSTFLPPPPLWSELVKSYDTYGSTSCNLTYRTNLLVDPLFPRCYGQFKNLHSPDWNTGWNVLRKHFARTDEFWWIQISGHFQDFVGRQTINTGGEVLGARSMWWHITGPLLILESIQNHLFWQWAPEQMINSEFWSCSQGDLEDGNLQSIHKQGSTTESLQLTMIWRHVVTTP